MKTYTALGDSITAGIGASSPTSAYPCVVAKWLREKSCPTAVGTFAYPSWTSTDLRLALSEHDYSPVRKSSVTSIWIGGDNLIAAGLLILKGAGTQAIPKLLSQYEHDVIAIVKDTRRLSKTSIILCTQYNPFPNAPIAVQSIQALNGITQRIAFRYRTKLASVHQWFANNQAELIAGYRNGRLEDGAAGSLPVHPNDKGHMRIARGLIPLIAGN
ncbi:SGNH/GDSL hydrolase family protein [Cohnella cholangitidis]|uniref:SGNH/GDSL hydrolase family protein n=1 Tax=Cohnella cholangitidis TaxID=2598458 RepID=A0A7G5BYM6_9BACL|nr:SGNH/GDSL hydrolase family protein [Cohnella cholangitidis]QMV42060.1 SGNH/GDSL hydrolase family protein [Cohnella cholangitidis]